MEGGGENWVTHPWDWMTFFFMLAMAMMGASGYGGDPEAPGESWA